MTIDPRFGPLLAVGPGGVWVEALDDVAHALAPVDDATARALLARLRCARLLDGFRGAPPVDRDAVAAAIAAFSRLAVLAPWLEAAEVNPLSAGPDGAVAVDALVIPRRPRSARTIVGDVSAPAGGPVHREPEVRRCHTP